MGKTVLAIMLLAIMTKMLGFARDIVLAYFYGASDITDAYLVAYTIPNVVFSFVAMGIAASYIPVSMSIREKEGKAAAEQFTANLVNLVLLLSTVLVVLLLLFPGVAVNLFASGFSEETHEMAVIFTRFSSLGIFFTALMFVFRSYLETKDQFLMTNMSGLPLNVLFIVCIWMSAEYGLYWLAAGPAAAVAIQFLFIAPFIWRAGYRHRFKVSIKEKNIRRMMAMAFPVIIGVSADQINILVDRTIASHIAEGGISAIVYADKIVFFIKAVFITAIVTVMFPKITKLAARDSMDELKQIVGKVITAISLFVIPATVGLMLFSDEVTRLLYERGAFGTDEVRMTSGILFFYVIGLLGYGLRDVLTKVFYSLEDSKTPMINAFFTVTVNVVLNLTLSRYMGLNGLALATSIAGLSSVAFLYIALVRKVGPLHSWKSASDLMKAIGAAAIMAFLAKSVYEAAEGAGFWGLAAGIGTGVVVYAGIMWLMNVSDQAYYKARLAAITRR